MHANGTAIPVAAPAALAANPVPETPAAPPVAAPAATVPAPQALSPEEIVLQELIRQHNAEKTPKGLHIRLLTDPIFPPSKTEFTSEARPGLEKMAKELAQTARAVRVEVYTDSSGQKAKNMQISKQRAARVLELLQTAGVKDVKAEGYGDASPRADNKTAEGRKNNRRVEVYIEDGK